MKKTTLLALATAIALAVPASAEIAAPETDAPAPFLDEDVANARFLDAEWVIRNNPVLMKEAVGIALRESPGLMTEIIRETLVSNPEIVIAALQEFQKKQAALEEKSAHLDPELVAEMTAARNAPVRGNPDGSVTLVKFADYNCGHCRRASKALNALIEKLPFLRVVHREWAILGEESEAVARLALAAREQDAYEALHEAFMGYSGKLDRAAGLKLAADLGLDVAKLVEDAEAPTVDAHLQETREMAMKAGFRGTPSMVVGSRAVRGLIPGEQLEALIKKMNMR